MDSRRDQSNNKGLTHVVSINYTHIYTNIPYSYLTVFMYANSSSIVVGTSLNRRPRSTNLGHFQLGSYRYRSLIEGLSLSLYIYIYIYKETYTHTHPPYRSLMEALHTLKPHL